MVNRILRTVDTAIAILSYVLDMESLSRIGILRVICPGDVCSTVSDVVTFICSA